MKTKIKPIWIILTLLILGFILRIWALGNLSYWIDETFSILASMKILEHGFPLLDSGIEYTRSIPHTYLLAFIGLFFSFSNEIAMRFPSVIFGTLMIPIIYFLTSKIYSKKAGVVSAILVTFSYIEIVWSRQARMYMMLQMFFFLVILLIAHWEKTKNVKTWYWIISITAITIFIHKLSLLLLPFIFLYLILTFIKDKKIVLNIKKQMLKRKKSNFFILLLLFIVISYSIKHGINYLFHRDYLNFFGPYHHYLWFSIFTVYLLSAAGFAVSKNRKWGFLLGITFIINFVLAAFTTGLIHPRYLMLSIPILFIFIASLFDYFYEKSKLGKVLAVIMLIAVLTQGFTFLPSEKLYLEDGTPQPDFSSAYSSVPQNETLIVSHTAPAVVYGLNPDYWIAFDISGRKRVPSFTKKHGTDVYNGIPAIINESDMVPGVYIADDMALQRMNPSVRQKIINSSLIDSYDDGFWKRIWVYRVDNSNLQ
ncbi:MAG: ArnT family glycosyltransferase [Nanobdellota archaeon]